MKRLISSLAFMLLLVAGAACADNLKDVSDKVPVMTERLAKLNASKVSDATKNQISNAQETLGALKAAISAKNGSLALQKSELTDIQLTIAEAKAAEMESSEQLVLRRTELKKIEAQFDQLLQTGGK